MLRTAFLALLLACAPAYALAQDYSGTYTASHPTSGGKIILELKQDADRHVSGTLSGNGNSFDVAAEVVPEGLIGEVTGENAMVFMVAQLSGAQLIVQLFEPDATGAPDAQSAREMRLTRE